MASPSLVSGNPALNEKVRDTYFVRSAAETRSMTVGGTAAKTFFFFFFFFFLLLLFFFFFFFLVLMAGGAWGWASATKPIAADLGGGYGNTTVTIPGGFWLASFGAFFMGIFAAMNRRRPVPSACCTPCSKASASARSPQPLGELFDLENLAADCAANGVYDGLFVAAMPIVGAGRSPLNPIVIK